MHFLVRVAEIKGSRSVYEVGDNFKLEDGCRLVSQIPLLYAFTCVDPRSL
jgi:hypothetical protein